jgi:hypothetical protein
VAVALLAPLCAMAVEGGSSNYTPGSYGDFGLALPPDPGLHVRNDLSYYRAHEGRSVRQDRVTEASDLELVTELPTLVYVPRRELLGARFAAGVGLPVVGGEISSEGELGRTQRGRYTGIGDLWLLPGSLYWTVHDLNVAWHEEIIVPTAPYDVNRELNGGLNYWSVDTNLAVTYLYEATGSEVSVNGGHIVNTENPATRYRSGQELHLDYMLNQYIGEEFAIGADGFLYRQITGDSGAGAVLGSFEAEAAGVGPALAWTPKIWGKSVDLSVKWLNEFHSMRRFGGNHVIVSLAVDL